MFVPNKTRNVKFSFQYKLSSSPFLANRNLSKEEKGRTGVSR
jgi:hypothetical protein